MGQKIEKDQGKKTREIKQINFTKKKNFFNFKIGQKSIFEQGKSLKLPQMQFNEKKVFDLFDFKSFFCLDPFKFSGTHCNMCT